MNVGKFKKNHLSFHKNQALVETFSLREKAVYRSNPILPDIKNPRPGILVLH